LKSQTARPPPATTPAPAATATATVSPVLSTLVIVVAAVIGGTRPSMLSEVGVYIANDRLASEYRIMSIPAVQYCTCNCAVFRCCDRSYLSRVLTWTRSRHLSFSRMPQQEKCGEGCLGEHCLYLAVCGGDMRYGCGRV
jgi:hypothetical protein